MKLPKGIPKKLYMADLESDGLLDTCTKIHVLSICELNPITMLPIRDFSLTDYNEISEYVKDPDITWVFHNGQGFDRIVLEKFIGELEGEIIDTLGLSWYLYPKRHLHGLKAFGEELGIIKPSVDDWETQKLEVYINRCEEDVKIQTALWKQMFRHLMLLYRDADLAWKAARYISSKMYALSIAYKSKWKLKVPEAEKLHKFFIETYEKAEDALEINMPMVPVYVKKTRPKKPFKNDGTLSAIGFKWAKICQDNNKDFDYGGEITLLKGYKDPNAGSHAQIKSWLFDLGWKPTTFAFKREEKGVRKIPQIRDKDKGELCSDIVRLIDTHSELSYLQDMSIVKHRSSVVGGFLKNKDSEGCIVAGAQGFTNTLRLRHKVALNIPSTRKPYGEEIRGLLIPHNTNYELLGSDMASLEDRTKQHYMFPHDPDYVNEMNKPGFDPHLDMAVAANMMTKEEADEYKDENTGHDRKVVLSLIRHAGKSTNYASVYGAGAATIARAAGVTEKEGEVLHDAYWKRNWSVKAIADECLVKESRGMKWLWNPVANMWYHLKAEKDRFSTLNQGTGSYVFDMWVDYIIRRRPQLNAQFHDEIILEIRKDSKAKNREKITKLLKNAIKHVNKECKLNRDLDIDISFGESYAQIH